MVGEAGDEFTEGGEVADCDVELDAAVVGADAFASAVAGEFGADGEGPGFEFLDGVAVALDEVESGGVAVGEAVEGGAAVGAAGREGDGDAGDLGVDFEVGFAADGDAGGGGGAVGGVGCGGGGFGHVFTVARRVAPGVCVGWSSDRNLRGVLRVWGAGPESTRVAVLNEE